MGGKTPLRRRRLGGGNGGASGSISSAISGGNPNEPDGGECIPPEHDVGPGGSGPATTTSSSSSSSLPLHHTSLLRSTHSSHYSNDIGVILEEGRGEDKGGDDDDVKVHAGPSMSFGAALKRTLTASVHSSIQYFGRDASSSVASSRSRNIHGGIDGETTTNRLQSREHAGLTILDASIERRDWRAVVSIVNSPAGVSLASRRSYAPLFYEGRFGTKLLPLHRACMYNPPSYVVEALVRANPEGARTAESMFNRVPLHLACRSGLSSVDTARVLLLASGDDPLASSSSSFSAAATSRDKLGRLPLHYCLANGAHPSIVSDLVAAYPSGLSKSDSEGWLPLHVACGSGVDLVVVEYLVRAYPQAVDRMTRWGSRPFDCARMFVEERYANRIDELFCKDFDTHAQLEGREEEGRWEGVSAAAPATTREGIPARTKPTSRFAR